MIFITSKEHRFEYYSFTSVNEYIISDCRLEYRTNSQNSQKESTISILRSHKNRFRLVLLIFINSPSENEIYMIHDRKGRIIQGQLSCLLPLYNLE